MAVDSYNITSNGGGTRFWFSAPGTYVLHYFVPLFTGHTSVTAYKSLYTSLVQSGQVTVYANEGLTPITTTDGKFFSGEFTIVCTASDQCVDFIRNPEQVVAGSGAGVVIDGTIGTRIRVTRV